MATTTVSCTATDNAGNRSTPVTFKVTVVDVPPVVAPDTAATLEGVSLTIPVLANDVSPIGAVLSIAGVTAPAHGAAVIDGLQVTYTPAANFFGADTFGYTASDGVGGFTSTTVAVNVSRVGRFVAFSTERTFLGDSTNVFTGDVGANIARADNDNDNDHDGHRDRDAHSDTDGDEVTVWLDERVTMLQSISRVVGATVRLDQQVSIYNLVDNQTLNHSARVLGTTTSPVTLPFMRMPAFPTVMTAGTQDVTVANGKTVTLGPGNYGRVRVRKGGTLKFSGGLYQVRTLDLGGGGDHAEGDRDHGDHDDGDDRPQPHATVIFQGATEIRLHGLMATAAHTQMILDPVVAGLKASQVVIYVAGTDMDRDRRGDDRDGGNRHLQTTATHVDIGRQNTIQANIYAPNGTVRLGSQTKAIGAFFGKHVMIGEYVELTLDSAFR
jgi:hypothetical protein